MPKFVLLWTDLALYLLVAGTLVYAWRTPSPARPARQLAGGCCRMRRR